jgi:hypothetical protein
MIFISPRLYKCSCEIPTHAARGLKCYSIPILRRQLTARMSSMTTTLTPVEAGTPPLRLTIPTTSYWNTLQEADRLGSINALKYRKLGRRTGWFPAGVVLKKRTEEIYPTITKIINDAGNYERIFGKHNKEVTRPCWLYMVGEGQQWMAARPTIVAICSKTRIAQRICDLLQNIACIEDFEPWV